MTPIPKNAVIPVVGVTFEAENVAKVKVDDLVMLQHEPSNPHDTNAISVHVHNVGKVGYLPKTLAERFIQHAQNNQTVTLNSNANNESYTWEAVIVECLTIKENGSQTFQQVGLRLKLI